MRPCGAGCSAPSCAPDEAILFSAKNRPAQATNLMPTEYLRTRKCACLSFVCLSVRLHVQINVQQVHVYLAPFHSCFMMRNSQQGT